MKNGGKGKMIFVFLGYFAHFQGRSVNFREYTVYCFEKIVLPTWWGGGKGSCPSCVGCKTARAHSQTHSLKMHEHHHTIDHG